MSFKLKIAAKMPLKHDDITLRFVSESDGLKMMFMTKDEDTSGWTLTPPAEEERSFSGNNKAYTSLIESSDRAAYGIYLDYEFMGRIDVMNYNPRNHNLDLSFYMLPPYRGKGYMTKAMKALAECIFENSDVIKLTASCGEFNTPAVKVMESAGFQQAGVLPMHHEFDGKLYDELIYCLVK